MKLKNIIIVVFVMVALIQIYVPAKMILEREDVIKNGKVYNFKTRPIDPNDPFRGKYIVLRFEGTEYQVVDSLEWERNEDVYVQFLEKEDGFSKIKAISKEKPSDHNYLKTKVKYGNHYKNGSITIKYPFTRYYMEESKAKEAEIVSWESQRDTTKITYAQVRIKEGKAVLTDVLINGVSIREIVKKKQE